MIRFILNDKLIQTELAPGTLLLDFIRYHQGLPGTKIGCREGDCGACTILTGDLLNGELHYQSMTCCLMPIANANGKHIVTIEGINLPGQLSPIQKAMADEGATQCGFCTPGFIMSLTGYCLSHAEPHRNNVIASIDGNICRCTGYKSIERAATKIAALVNERQTEEPAIFLTSKNILPAYFTTIKTRLADLQELLQQPSFYESTAKMVGGGTDLYVQKPEEMIEANNHYGLADNSMKEIRLAGDKILIGASNTVTDLQTSEVIQNIFPNFGKYAKLISSTPIRNMATIAGNFVNASPIGDLSILFLALDAQLQTAGTAERIIPLRKLYRGYKKLNLETGEYIRQIWFFLPGKNDVFHFEKVSKRTHLDIATVNTAINLNLQKDVIINASISAGGVGPTPLYLERSSEFLKGKQFSAAIEEELLGIVQSEISPISDARGTKEYKRLLLTQLIRAHFMQLIPKPETV